ncbi:MAG TPA: hypothetical protein VNO52_18605 [Methylomirabilota bacterium]|nr:hypothetical protein [Methylomirabilota bacterium]
MKTTRIVSPTVARARGLLTSLVAVTALGAGFAAFAGNGNAGNPRVIPPHANAFGKSLGEWSAAWWKFGIEHPVDGNPFAVGGCFDLSPHVVGFAGPLATHTLYCTVPAGKALFIAGITIECSSLEPPESGFHGDTAEEQAECARFWADHIENLSIEIDGRSVQNIGAYRVVSPQFAFTAPDPNILGVAGGGAGTGVADGYYVMVPPLPKGLHTTRVRGVLRFSVAEGDPFDLELPTDTTFHITVE